MSKPIDRVALREVATVIWALMVTDTGRYWDPEDAWSCAADLLEAEDAAMENRKNGEGAGA